jgi:uncharacterized repeat protein (TIGR02543 family)
MVTITVSGLSITAKTTIYIVLTSSTQYHSGSYLQYWTKKSGNVSANPSAKLPSKGEQKTVKITYNANGGTLGTPTTSSGTAYNGGTASITLRAGCTRGNGSANGYVVTFNANGGTTTKASQTQSNTVKYTFSKWGTTTSGGTQYSASTAYTFSSSQTLYAIWSSSTTAGSVTLPTAAQCTRAGYELLGWSTSSTATTASYSPGASYKPTAATTLYAVWKAKGLIRIYDGSSWRQALCYVYDGSSWR